MQKATALGLFEAQGLCRVDHQISFAHCTCANYSPGQWPLHPSGGVSAAVRVQCQRGTSCVDADVECCAQELHHAQVPTCVADSHRRRAADSIRLCAVQFLQSAHCSDSDGVFLKRITRRTCNVLCTKINGICERRRDSQEIHV